MIVVDTNIVTHFLIEGEKSSEARNVWQRDNEWRLPVLWQFEFANVLATHGKAGFLPVDDLKETMLYAKQLFAGRELPVNPADAVELAVEAKISAYDAQFVVLSQVLGVPLVTEDKKLVRTFPDSTIDLAGFQ